MNQTNSVVCAKERSFESVDEAVLMLTHLIETEGKRVSPRGLLTREIRNVVFTIANPRKRLVWNPARRWSPFLAVGEFLWHLAGERDASHIAYYAPNWSQFSTGGIIRSSCYGYKMFEPGADGISQWDHIRSLLESDSQTRRAVINLLDAESDLLLDAVDIACASSMQFLLRDGRLDMTVYMRSNDAIWGLPYDCFTFTMLQEMLACQLGCELGEYVHFAASLHVYERHFPLMERLLAVREIDHIEPMPEMPVDCSVEDVLTCERIIREGGNVDMSRLDSYWRDLLIVLQVYRALKAGDDRAVAALLNLFSEPIYRKLLTSRVTAYA